jgi:hypothetical protein
VEIFLGIEDLQNTFSVCPIRMASRGRGSPMEIPLLNPFPLCDGTALNPQSTITTSLEPYPDPMPQRPTTATPRRPGHHHACRGHPSVGSAPPTTVWPIASPLASRSTPCSIPRRGFTLALLCDATPIVPADVHELPRAPRVDIVFHYARGHTRVALTPKQTRHGAVDALPPLPCSLATCTDPGEPGFSLTRFEPEAAPTGPLHH